MGLVSQPKPNLTELLVDPNLNRRYNILFSKIDMDDFEKKTGSARNQI